MKNLNKLIATVLIGSTLVGCNDLDAVYEGFYVTNDQKAATLEAKPELALAGVTAIASTAVHFMSIYADNHGDFGIPALLIGMDSQGTDMLSRNVGYNWFQEYEALSGFDSSGLGPNIMWLTLYQQINSANSVLVNIPADTENAEMQMYRAQALGYRAFDYWMLAQNYQINYYGHENLPCVPIITEENMEVAANEGCARSTTEEVYAQILSDINNAIALAEKSQVSVSQLIDSKPRRMLSLDAMYGLRARIYLTMHKYAEAAADADKAISLSSCTPYSIEEVSHPSFTSLNDHSWMWGIAIAETDRVVTSGIVNFPSHICSFAYGYVTVGAWRGTNAKLFNAIPESDVRRGWFLDENFHSDNLTEEQEAYLKSYGTGSVKDTGSGIFPYVNVKYDSYNSVLNQNTNASDIPLMRIEEMYYIKAEGLAMSGQVAQGLEVLTNFEKTYRNPDFSTKAATAEEVQELIWNKRRLEFWGEGLSWLDLKRLNKGVDRRGLGFPAAYVYNVKPDTEEESWVYALPHTEVLYNDKINENNREMSRPPVIAED